MMSKKVLVTSIFSKLVDTSPPCRNNPQTTSFRAGGEPRCTVSAAMQTGRLLRRGEMYKTVNSVYFDDPAAAVVDDEFSSLDGDGEVLGDESCFSTTTASEAVVRSLQGWSTSTHRFFFDPGPPAIRSSVLPTTTTSATPPLEPAPSAAAPDVPEPDLNDDCKKDRQRASKSLAQGSVAVAVDSWDRLGDFRASMDEMVSAHGLRDWPALDELLSLYLRVNAKRNHPLIVRAFVDLLVGLSSSPPRHHQEHQEFNHRQLDEHHYHCSNERSLLLAVFLLVLMIKPSKLTTRRC
jgi:uncharacterized protein (TIGR01568 family)